MKVKKSKIMRNMAGIIKDLISARRELRHVQSEIEYRQLNALVVALEVELESNMEDMKKDKNVEVVSPPIHTTEHGTQPSNSDWHQRWMSDDHWLKRERERERETHASDDDTSQI
ncbi:uncharacterized protein LOC119987201 [Tripterygium wilfordii]|uniref:uncharacterized protein LOC119987201 n=1 Tax=Tripterygium wilfordii TaxID=458696 RepID=UPI0018F862C3|nr:uncharacterized protein LOC119987201 [Tripterygium wilfordii]XP_038688065.1 uncharacterized protein LOC119987201 [Tripterygium wilfordii]